MGNQNSQSTESGESSVNLQQADIRRLERRFNKLDVDRSGGLKLEELLSIPGLQCNPLVHRVFQLFDTDGSGEINFAEFVRGIAQFSEHGHDKEKLRFAFRLYDVDGDGYISNGELFQVTKSMVGKNVSDEQLQQIVDKSVIYLDIDGDGKISFPEFCQAVKSMDIHKKLTLRNI